MTNNGPISIGPGKAVYPRLAKPDTKYDELGQYKADVSMPLADAEPIMEILSETYKAHTGMAPKKAKNTMWYFETNKDGDETNEDGDETGNVVFKCRVKNKLRKRDGQLWDRKPKLFDAALKPVDVNPFGGSTYVVSAEVYAWEAGAKKGISLQPLGVQVLDLVSGSGPSASSMGFKAQEGYTTGPDEGDCADGDDDTDTGNSPSDDTDDSEDDGDY